MVPYTRHRFGDSYDMNAMAGLIAARKRAGLSRPRAAEAVGCSPQQIQKLERGERRLTWDWAIRLARAYDCDPRDLMFGGRPATVPIVGYVGAGAKVFPINDLAPGQGLDRAPCPRGLDPTRTVAVVVRGDSMLPIDDGWLLFYTRADEPPDQLVGRLCVVEVVDGPTLVKRLGRGFREGRYTLYSTNAAPIEDVPLAWAARVRAIVAPDDGETASAA